MNKHVKNYLTFFGYEKGDWIPSEISGCAGNDIHHIHAKKMGGRKQFEYKGKVFDIDAIENLICLTRLEHEAAHDPTRMDHLTKDELWELHKKKLEAHERVSKSRMQ
jgi:hypothetical protein